MGFEDRDYYREALREKARQADARADAQPASAPYSVVKQQSKRPLGTATLVFIWLVVFGLIYGGVKVLGLDQSRQRTQPHSDQHKVIEPPPADLQERPQRAPLMV